MGNHMSPLQPTDIQTFTSTGPMSNRCSPLRPACTHSGRRTAALSCSSLGGPTPSRP